MVFWEFRASKSCGDRRPLVFPGFKQCVQLERDQKGISVRESKLDDKFTTFDQQKDQFFN